MSAETLELVVDDGVLTFDGRVLEVKGRGSSGMTLSPKVDDAEFAKLERFVAEVKSRLGGSG